MPTSERLWSGSANEGARHERHCPGPGDLATWHEAHDAVTAALRPGDRLPEHVALETYAVLSRLPAPYRLSADAVGEVLRRRFPPRTSR